MVRILDFVSVALGTRKCRANIWRSPACRHLMFSQDLLGVTLPKSYAGKITMGAAKKKKYLSVNDVFELLTVVPSLTTINLNNY